VKSQQEKGSALLPMHECRGIRAIETR
jgi:hypothetical protein